MTGKVARVCQKGRAQLKNKEVLPVERVKQRSRNHYMNFGELNQGHQNKQKQAKYLYNVVIFQVL